MKRLCLCLLLSFVAPALADDPPIPFTGKVVKVTDGDTIHVLLDKETHKIRLLHIDAPESKQAGINGVRSRKSRGLAIGDVDDQRRVGTGHLLDEYTEVVVTS